MTRDLLFEIGTEEIPSAPLYGAIEQLKVAVPKALDDARLEYGEVELFATPRRMAVFVTQLAERQSDRTERSKGPAVKAAFDADGNPTKAAEGFARGKGVAVSDLVTVEDENGAYVYAIVEQPGRDGSEVLPELLTRLAAGIEWPKSQRWGSGETRFSRPVRWLVALFGADVVPVRFAGLEADRVTRTHRFLAPEPVALPSAEDYAAAMRQGSVLPDVQERARLVREGVETAAAQAEGRAVISDKVFAEVVNLVEWPTVGIGTFDEEFLAVPREILQNAMESHQRYFPVETAEGALSNRFIVVHNGDPARTDEIVHGHERVIRARLADAAFFYHEDLGHPLEFYADKLRTITFQEKLGTLADKAERIEALTERLGDAAGASAEEIAFARRAGHLAKADLVTSAVVEFTSLQGVMGGYYAAASGEEPQVATAIVEHYQPRFSGDALPSTVAGRLVAIADKLDTIAGIFAIGMAPTGSADPFGLRRSAIGVLQMLLDGTRLTLDAAISAALEGYSSLAGLDSEATGRAIKEFLDARLETILRERGIAYDTVDAVLAVADDDPADALARATALTSFRAASDDMEDLSTAFSRAKNLSKPELGVDVDRAVMGDHELALADALDGARDEIAQEMQQRAYSAVLENFAGMREPIDAFFDNVLVMDDDQHVRENRLRLLNRFVALFEQFADFSKLAG